MDGLRTLIFDIDGTICPQCEGDYENLKPYPKAVEAINKLHEEGHKIIFYTARFMGRTNNDVIETHKQGYDFTKNQLESWGLKFHELHMGKPRGDIIIDDRSVFFKPDWKEIYKKCTSKTEIKN